MLAESAKRLQAPGSSSERELAEQEFTYLNKELFGEVDQDTFDGMLTTEQARANLYVPTNEAGARVKEQLQDYFAGREFDTEEKPIIDEETLGRLQAVLLEQFADIVSCRP